MLSWNYVLIWLYIFHLLYFIYVRYKQILNTRIDQVISTQYHLCIKRKKRRRKATVMKLVGVVLIPKRKFEIFGVLTATKKIMPFWVSYFIYGNIKCCMKEWIVCSAEKKTRKKNITKLKYIRFDPVKVNFGMSRGRNEIKLKWN